MSPGRAGSGHVRSRVGPGRVGSGWVGPGRDKSELVLAGSRWAGSGSLVHRVLPGRVLGRALRVVRVGLLALVVFVLLR